MSKRQAAVRRLVADLSRSETRGDAVRRVRSKAAREWRARTGGGSPTGPARPVPAKAADEAKRVARDRAMSAFGDAFARGEPLERAVHEGVDRLTDILEWHGAWALAEGVGRMPGGATASRIGHAVLHHRRRQFERVWTTIQDLDDAILAAFMPVEAVDAAISINTTESRRRALAIGAPLESMGPDVLVDLAGRFLAFDERDRAGDLIAELRGRADVVLDDRRRYSASLIEGWLDRHDVTVPDGAIPVAVLDYQTPDHGLMSGNVGDYIQTLAMLGNLVRMSNVTFTGEAGLGEVATGLQARVRPDLRSTAATGSIHLIPVDRDFSSGASVPDGTWMLAFGWHMHALYDLRSDFPYHPNLRPLYISFHVNRLEMLTEAAKDELRRHGPVGCRDWTTVFLLLSAGIDAFFSGCLTTTVDALFPARRDVYHGKGAVGVIDRPASAAGRDARNVKVYGHQDDAYRYMSASDGLRAADATLAGYQRDLERVVTGRLHAYLPLTSLGVPVEFKTGSPGDVRFAGLMGFQPDDPRLVGLRTGIRTLIETVFERILAGATEDDVRGLWRDLTRGHVEEAKARFTAPVDVPPTTVDVPAAVASARAASRRSGPHDAVDAAAVTDVVLAYDQNLTSQAAVLIESMLANASGPIRLWILGRGLSDAYQTWLGAAFPALPITFLPCDRITFGAAGTKPRRLTARITISTMDRLLLPVMLDGVSRLVYLDVDTVMLGDVRALATIDLGGYPIAARDANVTEDSEWRRAGRSLPEDLAMDLRRDLGHRHGFGHAALNAGVLVLDLDRMRADDFTNRYLGWVERYGFHDQDTMLAYVGPDRVRLEPEWNTMAVMEDVPHPRLIHWAMLGKPWDGQLTYAQERWQAYATSLRSRAGDPPSGDGAATVGTGRLEAPVQIGPVSTSLSPRIEQVIASVRAERLSYLGAANLRTLAATVEAIEADGIQGLIVECGTARGGSAIVMAAAKASDRPMRVYDVFGMIPPPGEKDGADVHERYATIVSGGSTGIGGDVYYGYRDDLLAEVTASFAANGVPVEANAVELIQGRFEDTIAIDEPVALAHLDGDWYSSTMTCLTRIAPQLAVGGRLVIDDYDMWSGCKAAVDEYFADRPGFRFERRGRLHIVRV